MSATSTLADVNDTVLELVTSVQERIVAAHREIAGRAADVVPPVPFVGTVAVTARETAEQAYDFQAKVVEANKRFALGLFEAWAPVAGTASAE